MVHSLEHDYLPSPDQKPGQACNTTLTLLLSMLFGQTSCLSLPIREHRDPLPLRSLAARLVLHDASFRRLGALWPSPLSSAERALRGQRVPSYSCRRLQPGVQSSPAGRNRHTLQTMSPGREDLRRLVHRDDYGRDFDAQMSGVHLGGRDLQRSEGTLSQLVRRIRGYANGSHRHTEAAPHGGDGGKSRGWASHERARPQRSSLCECSSRAKERTILSTSALTTRLSGAGTAPRSRQ